LDSVMGEQTAQRQEGEYGRPKTQARAVTTNRLSPLLRETPQSPPPLLTRPAKPSGRPCSSRPETLSSPPSWQCLGELLCGCATAGRLRGGGTEREMRTNRHRTRRTVFPPVGLGVVSRTTTAGSSASSPQPSERSQRVPLLPLRRTRPPLPGMRRPRPAWRCIPRTWAKPGRAQPRHPPTTPLSAPHRGGHPPS